MQAAVPDIPTRLLAVKLLFWCLHAEIMDTTMAVPFVSSFKQLSIGHKQGASRTVACAVDTHMGQVTFESPKRHYYSNSEFEQKRF